MNETAWFICAWCATLMVTLITLRFFLTSKRPKEPKKIAVSVNQGDKNEDYRDPHYKIMGRYEEQEKFRDRCINFLKELKQLVDNHQKIPDQHESMRKEFNETTQNLNQLICAELPKTFEGSRAAECIAMSLCCTAIMRFDVGKNE